MKRFYQPDNTRLKYLRLLLLFWRTSLKVETEYRLNFYFAVISSFINFVGSVFGLSVFYKITNTLGGWTFEEALVVMGIFILIEGFSQSVLNPNLNYIVEYVWKGTLDFVLLKPVDSQFYLSFRNFSIWGIPNALFGLGLIIYGALKLKAGLLDIITGIFAVFISLLILYSIWFVLGSLSIWFVKIYNITFVLRQLIEAGRYPITAYPEVYRFIFTFVVPVIFLTTVPASFIKGGGKTISLIISMCVAVFLFVFSRIFWNFARRHYSSASS
ncbi:MAG: ABC-2 family transporter protein [candidate division WOR-3 bacterium]